MSKEAYRRAVELVDQLYLYPDDVDAGRILQASARHVADRVHWLMVESDGGVVYLTHGSGDSIGSVSVEGMQTLPGALFALEGLVREAGYPLGDVDLRLEVLKGLTDSLDRYTRVMSGDRLARFDVRLTGTQVGVGATLRLEGNELRVASLVSDGPAGSGGLAVGDVLLRIQGVSTINMPVREAQRRVQGDVGTQVVLTVRRGGAILELTLLRAEVVVPNVHHRVLEGGVGYVRIDHFSQRTVVNLRESLKALRMRNAVSQGLVVDLRGNTGGSMKEAARAADQFVVEGLLLRTVGPDGGRVQNLQASMKAVDRGDELMVPVVVLVNERTASGSEILAGALLELDRAVLVGERTYGKGTVQKIYPIDDEARLKLTVAQYVLANDRHIAHGGLDPDVRVVDVVLDDDGAHFEALDAGKVDPRSVVRSLRVEAPHQGSGSPAPQVDTAVELARRSVLRAEQADREAVLEALRSVAVQMQVESNERLETGMASREIDWGLGDVTEPGPPRVDVQVEAERHAFVPDAYLVRVEATNRGDEALFQTLIELRCEGYRKWRGHTVALGRVEPGERATGEVVVRMGPGISRRVDEVTVHLSSAERPSVLAASVNVATSTERPPELAVSAKLSGEGHERRAHITLRNLSSSPMRGVEIYFSHPGQGQVELIDRAARVPMIRGRGAARVDLDLEVIGTLGDTVPLELVVEADGFAGELLSWPLALPTGGQVVQLQAPAVEFGELPDTAPLGWFELPVNVVDDGALDHVLVYANGYKAVWAQGTEGPLDLTARLWLVEGLNRLVVVAADDDNLTTRRQVWVVGEAPAAAVDAGE